MWSTSEVDTVVSSSYYIAMASRLPKVAVFWTFFHEMSTPAANHAKAGAQPPVAVHGNASPRTRCCIASRSELDGFWSWCCTLTTVASRGRFHWTLGMSSLAMVVCLFSSTATYLHLPQLLVQGQLSHRVVHIIMHEDVPRDRDGLVPGLIVCERQTSLMHLWDVAFCCS